MQQVDHIHIEFVVGHHARGATAFVGGEHVGAVVDQPFHHRGVAAAGSQHQGRNTEEYAFIDRCAGFMQHLNRLDIAAFGFAVVGGLGERGPALRRLGVDVGTGSDQYFDYINTAFTGGEHQRGFTRFIGGSVIGASGKQLFDLCSIARLGGGE